MPRPFLCPHQMILRFPVFHCRFDGGFLSISCVVVLHLHQFDFKTLDFLALHCKTVAGGHHFRHVWRKDLITSGAGIFCYTGVRRLGCTLGKNAPAVSRCVFVGQISLGSGRRSFIILWCGKFGTQPKTSNKNDPSNTHVEQWFRQAACLVWWGKKAVIHGCTVVLPCFIRELPYNWH